jgi:dienelactone hydrolase
MAFACSLLLLKPFPTSAEEPPFNRKEDVIYGRKYGTALTMDVFTPKKDAKGIGVVFVVSGGFFSSHEAINPIFSPITHVTPDDPPTLIIHGDEDKLVALQQSELIVDKFKKTGVETTLVVKKGAGHGWPGLEKDLIQFAEWFDQHLKKTEHLKSGGDFSSRLDLHLAVASVRNLPSASRRPTARALPGRWRSSRAASILDGSIT